MPVVLLLLPILWTSWKLAASGIVEIPVFSSLAYSVQQEPPVLIEPSPRSLEQILNASLANDRKTFSISLDSPLLTRALHDGLRRAGLPTSGSIDPDLDTRVTAQARTLDGQNGIELFLPLADQRTSLTAQILPTLLPNGELHLDVREVRIGNTDVPGWILKFGVDQLEQEIDRQLNSLLSTNVQLTDLKLTSDLLTLSGNIR